MIGFDLTPENIQKYIGKDTIYRFRLKSDAELAANAVAIINSQDMLKSQSFNFDSPMFGHSRSDLCSICGNGQECTCAHYGLIAMPYAIMTNPFVESSLVKVVRMICPYCSNLPIESPEFVLNEEPKDRFTKMYAEISKRFDKPTNSCYRCKRAMTHIGTMDKGHLLKFIHCPNPKNPSEYQIYNPNYIYSLLINISDETREYLGFPTTYDPRNFMTKYMVILPNKIRQRTIDQANSDMTAIYNKMTLEINVNLNNYYATFVSDEMFIPKDIHTDNFIRQYSIASAYYLGMLDTTTPSRVAAINKTIGKKSNYHTDSSTSLVGHLKGKEQNWFEKGINGTRHKTSARTVLGGATDLHSTEIGFPQKYCIKMGNWISVYKENLDICRQFVAQMANIQKFDKEHIRVIRYMNGSNGKTPNIKPNNALHIASQLMPGDKLYVSLLPGTLVMHCRFPAVREESWATHELVPTQHTVQTLPLAACGYKNADFDGDETGMYVNHGWYTDAESLLLNSLYTQAIDYKKGSIGVFYSTDTPYELNRFTSESEIGVFPVRDQISDQVIDRVSDYPPQKVIDIANHFLDIITGHAKGPSRFTNKRFSKIKPINYEDNATKIVNNKFDPDRFKIINQSLYIYLIIMIGAERTILLIDLFTELGYCSAKYEPLTLAREIRFYGDSEKEIQEIKNEYYKMFQGIEQSNMNSISKERKQHSLIAEQKMKTLPLLVDPAKGTNIDKQGLLRKFNNELYKSKVRMDPIIINGHRIQNTLGGNSRTCTAFSNYSTDPCAYGYVKHGYLDHEISPTDTFYDCMLQRRSMYDRGVGVAIGGYMSKEFNMAFGPMVTDSNGQVMYYDKMVSPCYGLGGYNPRYNVSLPYIDIELSNEEINKKYGARVAELHKWIREAQEDYYRVSNFTNFKCPGTFFNAGFDFEQYFKTFEKGKTDDKIIDELIEECQNIFAPPKMIQRYSLLNFYAIEYYLRVKLHHVKITQQIGNEIQKIFMNTLVETGEPVGLKASESISESLTQAFLDSIHTATKGDVETNKLTMTKGNGRFNELYSQKAIAPDSIVLTLGFKDGSKETATQFALEQETIYFCDIWVDILTEISTTIHPDVIRLHPDFDWSSVNVSNYYLKMVWNLGVIGTYDIKVSKIYSTLVKNFDKISFITGYVENSKRYIAYVYFKDGTKKEDIESYKTLWRNKNKSTSINGNILVNCFVSQNANNGEYIVQANIYKPLTTIRKEEKSAISYNSMAFREIILDPRIEPSKCKTNETKRATGKLTANVYDCYGVFEASARLNEEVRYCSEILSSVGNIAERHYKTISLGCLANGEYFFASANSASKSDGDYFRKICFEQAGKFTDSAARDGSWKSTEDIFASQYFGFVPKSGSGYSKTFIYRE